MNRNFCRKPWPGMQRGCPDPHRPLDTGISDGEANGIVVGTKIHGVFKATGSGRFPQTTRLLTDAPRSLRGALTEGGKLASIENRSTGQSNLFRFEHGRLVVEAQVGADGDVKSLVTDWA